ncbi:hypothetical protein DB346_04740 [Verrucomicrobia bacterium LW23]|nr:hypothetical protein DB346_04740 [Verrucomicrobia bacterium LW23]
MLHNASTLALVPAASLSGQEDWPHAAVVSRAEEMEGVLTSQAPALQWVEVEGLIGDPSVWARAAQGRDELAFDVVVLNPAVEYSAIYRLVDVHAVRRVRITMPASAGFSKAVRLAGSLGLPVRIVPGQPSAEVVRELEQAADFYLHHAMVEAPMEPFHTVLAMMHESGGENSAATATVAAGNASARPEAGLAKGQEGERKYPPGALWIILEEDPALYVRLNAEGVPLYPRTNRPVEPEKLPRLADFVTDHMQSLVEEGSECSRCKWFEMCGGYFKWPDRDYVCQGVGSLFSRLHAASREMAADLAEAEEEAQR